MTLPTGPTENAALAVLVPLLEGIVSGELIVVRLEAGDAEERALTIKWRDAEPTSSPPPAQVPPPPRACPSCGSASIVEVSGGERVCQDCAAAW